MPVKCGAVLPYFEVGTTIVTLLPAAPEADYSELTIYIQHNDIEIYEKEWNQLELIALLEDDSAPLVDIFKLQSDLPTQPIDLLATERSELIDYIKNPLECGSPHDQVNPDRRAST